MFKQKLKRLSDIELIKQFLSDKDSGSFGEIYERYFEDTYKFVDSRVGNKEWSEEIISNTFFTLIDVIGGYNGTSKLKSFIIGIALNKIRQFWTEKYKQNEVGLNEDAIILDEVSEFEKEDKEHITKLIKEILYELPENYKRTLVERFINNKSIKETSKVMNISEENVRVLQHRALKKALKIGNNIKNG